MNDIPAPHLISFGDQDFIASPDPASPHPGGRNHPVFQPSSTMTARRPGLPLPPMDDGGRLVCFCYRVGIRTLVRAIRESNLTTPEEISRALRAGSKCGSCLPELQEILRQIRG
jgi:bacterioferritin-associated ferredoxin